MTRWMRATQRKSAAERVYPRPGMTESKNRDSTFSIATLKEVDERMQAASPV